MQRASLGGRGAPVRDWVAARRASVEAIRWACIACAVLFARPAAAATFDLVTGTLTAKAGALAPTTRPAIIGSETVSSQIPPPTFASGQAALNLQNPNNNRFTFDGAASSLTQVSDPVQASYNFTQRFTTTVTQWMELTAKVNANPAGNPNVTALVTLGRVGQPVAFTIDHTSGEFEIVAGSFAAGNFELKSDVATTVQSGPQSRDAQTQGALQLYLFADFNGSGSVNSVDLATWRAGFGMTSGTFANGNLDDISAVDGRDFLIWQRQVGAVPTVLATGSAIPEPWTTAMIAVGALALQRSRRRRWAHGG